MRFIGEIVCSLEATSKCSKCNAPKQAEEEGAKKTHSATSCSWCNLLSDALKQASRRLSKHKANHWPFYNTKQLSLSLSLDFILSMRKRSKLIHEFSLAKLQAVILAQLMTCQLKLHLQLKQLSLSHFSLMLFVELRLRRAS